jgi:putative toxin-antitoxin system antitoxin component (TIGR02293 family)
MINQKFTSESILGVTKKDKIKLDSPLSYMQVSQNGLTRQNFDRLKTYTGLDTETLATILAITSRTIQRKKTTDTFRPDISEKMLEIADIYAFGSTVFEEKEKLQQWMNTQILALANKKPVELLSSSYGRKYIRQLLGRIEHGVFS